MTKRKKIKPDIFSDEKLYDNLSEFDRRIFKLCENVIDVLYKNILHREALGLELFSTEVLIYSKRISQKTGIYYVDTPRWRSLSDYLKVEYFERENICNWFDAVEVFAVLHISYAVSIYKLDFHSTFNQVVSLLISQTIDKNIQLPTINFPTEKEDFLLCPLCKTPLSNGLNKFLGNENIQLSLIYLKPLVNDEIRHHSANVRLGHSICKKLTSNNSVEKTIDIFNEILKSHGKNLPALQTDEKDIIFLKYEIDKSLQSISIAIKQYFDYFSEYVRRAKGKDIYFYVKPLHDGFEFRVNQNDVEVVEKYLTEYANLVNENIKDLVLNIENTSLSKPLIDSSYLSIKQQITNFQNSIEILSFEKNVIEEQNKKLFDIIKDLNDVIKEKSKQPIQIFNQTIPVTELKQLILDVFAEFAKINTIRITEEERILDYYLRLDKITIQNKPDYQKRINQWLPDYSKLNALSLEYLLSAEFLFDALFKADTNDYSPFVLQYCRVVENELLKQLFVAFYQNTIITKNGSQIQTDYAWDFVKANKNKDFANLFLQTTEPEAMLAKMLEYLKRMNDNSYSSSVLLSDFKIFISQYFDISIILQNDFIEKIDFIRENYRNKAAHPEKNMIKLNLSEAQKCQSLVREILVLWLENKK